VNEERVYFDGDNPLEGMFGWPGDRARLSAMPSMEKVRGGVVVTHPYPPAGANMDLPVVFHIAKECRHRHFASLRFNFRSVGASLGEFNGTEEHRDVAAAAAFMRERLAPAGAGHYVEPPIGLAGWSFGSVMAARAAAELEEVKALALVGFVVHWEHLPADTLERLARYHGPLLAVCAEHDHHGTSDEVAQLLRSLSLSPHVEVIEDADHYLQGHERKVGKLVADFFDEVLPR
jgi:alpha/beta superfamily hydrolase